MVKLHPYSHFKGDQCFLEWKKSLDRLSRIWEIRESRRNIPYIFRAQKTGIRSSLIRCLSCFYTEHSPLLNPILLIQPKSIISVFYNPLNLILLPSHSKTSPSVSALPKAPKLPSSPRCPFFAYPFCDPSDTYIGPFYLSSILPY